MPLALVPPPHANPAPTQVEYYFSEANLSGDQFMRDKIAAEKSSLFCINNRKASKEDDSSWLCGCTGRGKKTKIPKDGMPGIARSPSFPRKEDFDKAKEEKM